jgi:uridylate kinase
LNTLSKLHEIHDKGVEIAIKVGGGNIFRGVAGASAGNLTSRSSRLYGNSFLSHSVYKWDGVTRSSEKKN